MTEVATGAPALQLPPVSQTRRLGRQLWRRKSFVVGSVAIGAIVGIALLAPWLAPHDPYQQDLMVTLLPPAWQDGGSWAYPFGTDALGRDVLSRMMYGARNSLFIAFFAVLIAASLGLLAGVTAGFSRNWMDSLLMRLGDMQLAFPFILLAIIVLGVISDRSALHLIIVLGIPGWILYARVVRSRVLSEREKDYVTAAHAIGASRSRQVRKYVLPSVWQVVLVIALLDFGFVILVESTLSFLGFGLSPPEPSWGSILAEGKRSMRVAPWLAVLPGLAIMFTVLAINLTADGAADVLDPKLRKGVFRRRRQKDPGQPAAGTPVTDTPTPAERPLLRVVDLHTEFPFDERTVYAVRGIAFGVDRGKTLGIVGESGSGKSVTALSIMQLLDAPGRVTQGRVDFEGRDLTRISDGDMSQLRGRQLGMIFQNPSASLNPVMTVGSQMVETIAAHGGGGTDRTDVARSALRDVGIGDPDRVLRRYPFQLSGGMNQRVMIALAMIARPDLLIADEPTTALDVTTQAQVLEQLVAVTHEHDTALILITHDIALVHEYADDVIVMYAGRICESGPVREVVREPRHPYTRALLDSVPRADLAPDERLAAIPGELPDPSRPAAGCPFAARCAFVMDVCRVEDPPLVQVADGRQAACHLPELPGAPARSTREARA